MLRFIDGLRYHKPTPEESEKLNLSSATERIYLHVLNDVRPKLMEGKLPLTRCSSTKDMTDEAVANLLDVSMHLADFNDVWGTKRRAL